MRVPVLENDGGTHGPRGRPTGASSGPRDDVEGRQTYLGTRGERPHRTPSAVRRLHRAQHARGRKGPASRRRSRSRPSGRALRQALQRRTPPGARRAPSSKDVHQGEGTVGRFSGDKRAATRRSSGSAAAPACAQVKGPRSTSTTSTASRGDAGAAVVLVPMDTFTKASERARSRCRRRATPVDERQTRTATAANKLGVARRTEFEALQKEEALRGRVVA